MGLLHNKGLVRAPSLYKLPVPEKGVPRQGEQCPVEKFSYKGYSPPKSTCNDTPHIQVKTCTVLLKCLHVMDENVCDAPKPGGLVDHRQPVKTCVSHIMRPIHE